MNMKMELVQTYVTKDKVTVKNYLESRFKDKEYGWKVEGDWVIFYHSPTRSFSTNPLNSPNEISWKVEQNKIVDVRGLATKITPELNPREVKLKDNKQNVENSDLRIYEYINDLINNDIPENIAEKKTIEKFNLSIDELYEIYKRVEDIIYEH